MFAIHNSDYENFLIILLPNKFSVPVALSRKMGVYSDLKPQGISSCFWSQSIAAGRMPWSNEFLVSIGLKIKSNKENIIANI